MVSMNSKNELSSTEYCLHISPFVDGPLLQELGPEFVEKNRKYIIYSLIEHYFLVQKWSARCVVHSNGEEEILYLYCKDAHQENYKFVNGKLICIDYGCLTTNKVNIYDYLASAGLEYTDLGLVLVQYLYKNNEQQVDAILATIQAYLSMLFEVV